jgi:hypothetical protein
MDVRGHDRGSAAGQRPTFDDEVRTRRVRLLARLVECGEGLRQASFHTPRGPEHGSEGRHVHIVTAGMHEAVRGGEGGVGLLLYRQGVKLGPHDDGIPRRADAR